MNCQEVKNLLIEYIDGELDPVRLERVAEHLRVCAACGEEEKVLRQDIIEPIRKAERLSAPQGIWQKVRAAIEKKERTPATPDLILEKILAPFRTRRPALVLATAVVLILIAAVFVRLPFEGQEAVYTYIEEQIEFFSYLAEENGVGFSDMDTADVGTMIEAYLL